MDRNFKLVKLLLEITTLIKKVRKSGHQIIWMQFFECSFGVQVVDED